MYEINREIKTAKNRDAAMADVLTTIDSDLYDPTQLDPNYIDFLNQIGKSAAEEETDPGFTKTKNEKGETIYSYTYTNEAGEEQKIEGTVFDIQNKINGTKKDYEFITQQNEVIFEWEKWAKDHPNAKFDEVYSRISSNMETSFAQSPEKFKSIINHPMGWNKKSYVETLKDPKSPKFQNVIKVLDEMNASDFDYDGDGSITEADFVNEENINTMIQALTDPSATQRRTAHRAAATFYADTEARKAFDFGVRDRPKDEETTVDDGTTKYGGFGAYQFNTGGGNFDGEDRAPKSQTWKDAQTKRTALDALQTVRGTHATYTWNNDGYYEAEGQQFSIGEVAAIEGLLKGSETTDSAVFKTTTQEEDVAKANKASLVGEITPKYLQAPAGTTSATSSSENLNAFYNMPAYDYSFEPATMYRTGMGTFLSYYSDSWVALTDNDKNELRWDDTQEVIDAGFTPGNRIMIDTSDRAEAARLINVMMGMEFMKDIKDDAGIRASKAAESTGGTGSQYN